MTERYRLTLKPLNGPPIAQLIVNSQLEVAEVEKDWLKEKDNVINDTDYKLLIYTKEVDSGWKTTETLFIQK